MNRRSFFGQLVKAAAIVALAPRLAFKQPDLKFDFKEQPFWMQTARTSRCYDEDYKKALARILEMNSNFTSL